MVDFFKKHIAKIGISGIAVVIAIAINFYIEFRVQQADYETRYSGVIKRISNNEKSDTTIYKAIRNLERKLEMTDSINKVQHSNLGEGIVKIGSDLKSLTYIIIRNNKNMEKDLRAIKEASNLMTDKQPMYFNSKIKDTSFIGGKPSRSPSRSKVKKTDVGDIIHKNNKKLESELNNLLYSLDKNNIITAKK